MTTKEEHKRLVQDAVAALSALTAVMHAERQKRIVETSTRAEESLRRLGIGAHTTEEACRRAIIWIGELLFDSGGVALMHRVFKHKKLSDYSRVSILIEDAWDHNAWAHIDDSWFC